METTNQSPLTSFDSLTFSNRLQILKLCFPYMPPASRKFLSSYIKASELANALHISEEKEMANLGACSADGAVKNPLELLGDIKRFCSKKEQESIDMALNFFNAFQMYHTFLEIEKQDGTNNSFVDMVKSMLSPEQQSMFEQYQNAVQPAENG